MVVRRFADNHQFGTVLKAEEFRAEKINDC